MNAHVSSILLGVRDMDRSKRFSTEGLGWKIRRDYGVSAFFEPHGGSLVGFYGRDGLAANVGASPEGSGFSGLVLTYVARSQARVDEVMAEAERAGATPRRVFLRRLPTSASRPPVSMSASPTSSTG